MTRAEAEAYIRSCRETDGPDGDDIELTELFVALYDRAPDDDDRATDLWSLCCASVAEVKDTTDGEGHH